MFQHPLVRLLASGLLLASIVQTIPASVAHAAGNPPVLESSATTSYSPNGSPKAIAPTLTITDDDNENLDGARASITNLNAGTDRLGISGQGTNTSGTVNTLSWNYNTATGVLTLTGSAPVSTYQAALRQVTLYTTGALADGTRTVQFTLGSSLANPDNGHFYQFVTSAGVPWSSARTAAAAQRYFGLQGYLVTVTSATEQSFVASKIQGQGWMGATDSSVNKVWRWVTGPEGLEENTQGRLFFRQNGWTSDSGPNGCGVGAAASQPANQYANWAPNEPNDFSNGCAGGENYAHFRSNGQWNDYPATSTNVNGYVVEYGGMPGDPVLQITDSATVVVDGTAPTTPSITSPGAGSVTNDPTPTISGTAEAGSTVTVKSGETTLCTATADDGTWSCDVVEALVDGAYTLRVTAADALNNTSAAATRIFTIDATAPAAPIVTSPAADTATNDTTPTISGTAEPESTVTITNGDDEVCTATADESGVWNCEPNEAFVDGTVTLSVTVTDSVGNTNEATTHTFTVDTEAPAAPAITSPTADSVTNDMTPTISGTAAPGSTVMIMNGEQIVGEVVANEDGDWSYTPTTALDDGTYTLSVTATDKAGNTSAAAERTFTIDTKAPDAPEVTQPAEGSRTNDTTTTFGGKAEVGSTITVKIGEDTVCTETVDEDGEWDCEASTPFENGEYTVSVTATDAAGNVSNATERTFIIDTADPKAPVVITPAQGSVTNDTTPTISGTAEPGSTVTVTNGDTTICTATANNEGAWTCAPTETLKDGEYTISVTATDKAGNEGDAATRTFTVDATAPEAPTINARAPLAPKYAPISGWRYPILSGTAEPNATVTITVDPDNDPATNNNVVYTTTADANGIWTVDMSTATPTSGSLFIKQFRVGMQLGVSAVARDAAGNISPTAQQTVTIGYVVFAPIIGQ